MYTEIQVWNDLEVSLRSSEAHITLGRFIPLFYLSQGPLRLHELARCCHTKESALSRLVNRMQESGLIEKSGDPDDKRSVLLSITEEGLRLEERARDILCGRLEAIFGRFSEEQLHNTIALLGSCSDGMQGDDGR
jgi:DNA-binding MarR family transcriptional regulator